LFRGLKVFVITYTTLVLASWWQWSHRIVLYRVCQKVNPIFSLLWC